MDLLKQAEGFEALAAGGEEIAEKLPTPSDTGNMTSAVVASLKHAAKLTMKAAEELEKGRKQQAENYAWLAHQTLKDALSRSVWSGKK